MFASLARIGLARGKSVPKPGRRTQRRGRRPPISPRGGRLRPPRGPTRVRRPQTRRPIARNAPSCVRRHCRSGPRALGFARGLPSSPRQRSLLTRRSLGHSWSAISAVVPWEPARSPMLSPPLPPLVRHLDRLAEMRDRLGECRAAQRLIARLAPPFDREIVDAGLGEMMREHFGLGAARSIDEASLRRGDAAPAGGSSAGSRRLRPGSARA